MTGTVAQIVQDRKVGFIKIDGHRFNERPSARANRGW